MIGRLGPLPTNVGAARWGDNRFRGYSVNDDLEGRTTTWDALSLSVDHRCLTRDEVAILDDFVTCNLVADPRIWPLKVTRLVSSYGNASIGILAGIYSTEGGRVGWSAFADAAAFLQRLLREGDWSSRVTAALERGEIVPGFGVVSRGEDERAVGLKRCVERRGRSDFPAWTCARLVDEQLRPRGKPMNIAAGGAAILLDVGFNPEQIRSLGPAVLYPNYLANAVEGAAQAPEILRRLPDSAIDDRTPAPRKSPRALGKP